MTDWRRCLLPALLIGTAPVATAAQTAPATAAPGYLLGAGDKLRIIVFGEEALSGEYGVTAAGEVAFPLIGNVAAAGASPEALRDRIAARLRQGYIRDPRVSVEVLDYRPFFILGEVAKPGQYPYATGMTVAQAVATAGGYTYRASTRRIFIKHAADAAETRIDLRRGEPVPVQPGDTLRVAERFF